MKSMKKSMFVTTILMVVLLIVALSTATFAWYTTNTNVTAAKTQVVSATSSSASLVIDGAATTDPNATGSSVTLVMNQNIAPMLYTGATPATALAYGTTDYETFTSNFMTFTVDYSATKFASTAGEGTPATLTSVTGDTATGSAIFLSNIGGREMSSITAKVTIENYSYTSVDTTGFVNGETDVSAYYTKSGDVYTAAGASAKFVTGTAYYSCALENNKLCVALFAGAADAVDSAMKLVGIFSNLASIQVGDATALGNASIGDTVSSVVGGQTFTTKAAAGAVASENMLTANLAQNGAIKVYVVAWFEGSGMTNNIAGSGANFSMTFDATAAAAPQQ